MPKRITLADPDLPSTNEHDNAYPADDRRQRIAQRAYERFQQRGGEPGRDQEDWFEAERELNRSE